MAPSPALTSWPPPPRHGRRTLWCALVGCVVGGLLPSPVGTVIAVAAGALFTLHAAFLATESRWDVERVGPLRPVFLHAQLAFRRRQFGGVLAFTAFWVTCYGLYLASTTGPVAIPGGASVPGAGAGVPSTSSVTSGDVSAGPAAAASPPACDPGTPGCAAAGLAIYALGAALSGSLGSLLYHAGRAAGGAAARASARLEQSAAARVEAIEAEQAARLAAVKARRAEARDRWGGPANEGRSGGASVAPLGLGDGARAAAAPAPREGEAAPAPPPRVHKSVAALLAAAAAARAGLCRAAATGCARHAVAAGRAAAGRVAVAAGAAAASTWRARAGARLFAAVQARGGATAVRVAAWAAAASSCVNRVSSTAPPGALDVFCEPCPGPYQVRQLLSPRGTYTSMRGWGGGGGLRRRTHARTRSARCRS